MFTPKIPLQLQQPAAPGQTPAHPVSTPPPTCKEPNNTSPDSFIPPSGCPNPNDNATNQPILDPAWTSFRNELLGKEISIEDQKRFLNLYSYCLESGVTLAELKNAASKTLAKTNDASQKIDALGIVSVLLAIRRGGNDSFYAANSVFTATPNKDWIDAVYAQIIDGKLNIEKTKKAPGESWAASYAYKSNAYKLYGDFNPKDPLTKARLVHELRHFYADLSQIKLSKLEDEKTAYGMEIDFLAHDLGLNQKPFKEAYAHFAEIHQKASNGTSTSLKHYEPLFKLYYKKAGKEAGAIKESETELQSQSDAWLNSQYVFFKNFAECARNPLFVFTQLFQEAKLPAQAAKFEELKTHLKDKIPGLLAGLRSQNNPNFSKDLQTLIRYQFALFYIDEHQRLKIGEKISFNFTIKETDENYQNWLKTVADLNPMSRLNTPTDGI